MSAQRAAPTRHCDVVAGGGCGFVVGAGGIGVVRNEGEDTLCTETPAVQPGKVPARVVDTGEPSAK